MTQPHWTDAVALGLAAAFFVLLGWPRRRFTHHYELFVAAPPQTVWDTYFIHIKRADYRPGTRVLDAEILSQEPLTVRLRLQFDYAPAPTETVIVYDLFEPFRRYRARQQDGNFVEEGEFIEEVGGTRLRVAVTGRRRGFVLPAIARRRVERNQRALKDLCEGRRPEPPRPPLAQLAQPARWQMLVVVAAVAAPFAPLPWQVQLPLAIAGFGVGLFLLWRFAALLLRM